MFAQIRRKALDLLGLEAAAQPDQFLELALGTFRGTTAQMAFATFGAYNLARAGHAKALGSRLMRLQFIFLGLCLDYVLLNHVLAPKLFFLVR